MRWDHLGRQLVCLERGRVAVVMRMGGKTLGGQREIGSVVGRKVRILIFVKMDIILRIMNTGSMRRRNCLMK